MTMMLQFVGFTANPPGHVSLEARILTLFCGIGLCLWSILKLRKRSLLISTCSLFLAVGSVFILFAIIPNTFDRISYLAGVQYPPILYMIACVFALIVMIIHLATRVSLVDLRCRRLAQELALLEGLLRNRAEEMKSDL